MSNATTQVLANRGLGEICSITSLYLKLARTWAFGQASGAGEKKEGDPTKAKEYCNRLAEFFKKLAQDEKTHAQTLPVSHTLPSDGLHQSSEEDNDATVFVNPEQEASEQDSAPYDSQLLASKIKGSLN